eukprot:64483-Chlamydomonas_euryale.AAC.2
MEKYIAEAAGPTKWQRLAEFLRDAYGGLCRDLAMVSARRHGGPVGLVGRGGCQARVLVLRRDLAVVGRRGPAGLCVGGGGRGREGGRWTLSPCAWAVQGMAVLSMRAAAPFCGLWVSRYMTPPH